MEDMASCFHVRIEGRLSELRQVLHTQIEEVHIRAGLFDDANGSSSGQLSQLGARVAKLGSRCLLMLSFVEDAVVPHRQA